MDASSLSVARPQGQAVFRTGASKFGNVSPDTLIADFLPTLGMMAISLFLGYISARAGLLSPTELNGVSKLLGTFALPALLLQNLATTDLSTIQWPFVGGMAAAKLLVFVLVVGSTLVSERRKRGGRKGRGLVEAGLRGIMATQSNDFAFGVPICAALYRSSHPGYTSYLYLLAPISLVLLNPLAFILCEIVLVLAGKTLLLPVLAFFLVSLLTGTETDLAMLAFLIGAFPVGEEEGRGGGVAGGEGPAEGGREGWGPGVEGSEEVDASTSPMPPVPSIPSTDQASLSLAIVFSTLAALPILLLCVLSIEISASSSSSSDRLFSTSLFYLNLLAGITSAWTALVLLLQAFPSSHCTSLPPSPFPLHHHPILLLSVLTFLRAMVGCRCPSTPSASPSSGGQAGVLSFLLVSSTVAINLLTPLLSASVAHRIAGKRRLVSSLLLILSLSLVWGAVAKGGRQAGLRCTPEGGREGGRGEEALVLSTCGLGCVVSLWSVFWSPGRGGRAREGGREGRREEGGGVEGLQRPLLFLMDVEEEEAVGKRREDRFSRELLVTFLSLSMLITCIRCTLALLPSSSSSSSSPSSSFLFVDLAVRALVAPVLACLYGLDKELAVFQGMRWIGKTLVRLRGKGTVERRRRKG
ncbi:hypothetical protein NSK_006861 [Nannochloropsis salina CCMP1776]|uniref:Uncharacterized protein n=1 Tax=Nannochloropsis salina CCMP1776 TaxID=1027361 RepID=A0A4D9CR45_9STRA|nr:hypothetical protein NSK_006861 [Nannochloropsis salina CCMP1776]|eukprot:TFJ81610.1 hypothetical protein NSK_006861 [Nannochloropsis salina CCMP1776]